MARRPQIPEDVFFDESRADRESEDAQRNDQLARSRRVGSGPRSYRRSSEERRQEPEEPARVGRPPAQEGPKVAVTLYLTEPVAHLLEEARYLLLTEHGVKTSKSAIADFGLRAGLADLAAAAEDLRRD